MNVDADEKQNIGSTKQLTHGKSFIERYEEKLHQRHDECPSQRSPSVKKPGQSKLLEESQEQPLVKSSLSDKNKKEEQESSNIDSMSLSKLSEEKRAQDFKS